MNPEAGAEALIERVGVCVLDEERVLRVRGDDALPWLQGQVTQDVARLGVGESAYTLILGANGKIRSDAWVHRRADELLLVVPAVSADGLVAHLDAHVIMEDVVVSADPDHVVVTVQGPAASAVASGRVDALPADRLELGSGFDVLAAPDDVAGVRAALEDAAVRAGGAGIDAAAYELARIRRGVPRLGADFGENTLPQEAGLARRAVSFVKGCYLGQEPVVMLEHRGQPPKRLVQVRANRRVAAGSALVSPAGETVGRLTSVAPGCEPSGEVVGLALVKRAHASEGATLAAEGADVALVRLVGAESPPAALP